MAQSSLVNDLNGRCSRTSSDVSVNYEIQIEENGGKSNGTEPKLANDIDDSGSISDERNIPGETTAETSRGDEAGPASSQITKSEKHRKDNAFGMLAATFFDDKRSLRKRLKLLQRLVNVREDGSVQFDVPGDIKPRSLDFGTGVVYNGATDEGPGDVDVHNFPPLQIVMLIVGTRGDVQPFVAIGKRLQEYGHRVRLATHSNFKDFVLSSGLEFYPLGGDPKVLAGYMVKNKGFLPSGPSDIHIQRNQIKEIIFSLHDACVKPDPESGIPFEVDAIITNPPAYGKMLMLTNPAQFASVKAFIDLSFDFLNSRPFPGQIFENFVDNIEVSLTWVMHILAYEADCKCNVWSCV
ncbi:glycosyltransferase [Lithospermum erythrorhizon]|uniref:Glycosyltransferase n=1 Tax=Lithospermum erythrorhizon TaxID=34254 RepID=A0AAV3P6D2_LITER